MQSGYFITRLQLIKSKKELIVVSDAWNQHLMSADHLDLDCEIVHAAEGVHNLGVMVDCTLSMIVKC